MDKLSAFISRLLPFAQNELEPFVSLFSEARLSKNGYFSNEGEYATRVGFVTQGVLRAFYRNPKGVEYNKTFFTENNFLGAYSSLITKQKSLINIQSLTDCTFLVADFEKITQLYDHHPKIERFARVLAEQFFVTKETREIELVMLDAGERYKLFQHTYPNLENIIPQYHIASYLGVSPTQLSRIRAKN